MKKLSDSGAETEFVFIAGRHYLILGLILCLLFGLVVRAFYLQIIEQTFLTDQGQKRQIRIIETPAYRGAILDRHGSPLAISTPVDSVWVNPVEILRNLSALEVAVKKLDLNYRHTLTLIKQKADKEFVYLKRQLEPEFARSIAEPIDGIYLQREYHRYYPASEVVSHLVGFTDIDDNGQEGLELIYDNELKAQPGQRRVIRNRKGEVIEELDQVKRAHSGKDVVTSIDMRLQYIAYRSLVRAVQYHGAESGSAVLVDAQSGEVLAMVNQPSYNSNQRKKMLASQQRNRALTDVFEPGSTMKPFTLAASIDRGQLNSESSINTSPGWLMVSGHPIKDFKDYGKLDPAGILRHSSNVGVAQIALSLSAAELWQAFSEYGFGQSSGVLFPAESPGYLRHYAEWQPLDQATLGFGYGVSVSLIQLARAYSMIANMGQDVRITLLKKQTAETAADDALRYVMKPSTASMILGMMESVVGPKGTASQASIMGYRVAGKTGTAKKSSAGGYEKDDYIAVFAGIAPASNPRLVMVVMVDKPTRNGYYGGTVAAPVFHEVMAGALRMLDIAPDNPAAFEASLSMQEQDV